MGLTSLALAIVLACAVAGVLAIVLVGWRWLASPGASRLALRAGGLAVLQASVLCLVFVLVNRSLVFYSSWSDLLGTDNGGGQVAASRTEQVSTAGWLRVVRVSKVTVPGVPAAGGRLETVQIHGQLSGLTVPARLYLPPGFARPSSPRPAGGAPHGAAADAHHAAASPSQSRRYPVIVAITGRASSGDSPYTADHLAAAVATEIAAGRLRPVILLVLPAGSGAADGREPARARPGPVPSGTVPPGQAGCLNVPGGRLGETFVAEDVPHLLQDRFRASREPWALLGDQAGGYCSLELALSDPDAFAVAAVPPAGYAEPPAPALAGGSPQVQDQEDPAWLLRHQPAPPVSLLFAGPGGTTETGGATETGGSTETGGGTETGGTSGPRGTSAPDDTAAAPGRASSLAALARPPLRVASARLAGGRFPLAPVLAWIGSVLGRDAWD
jgi:hypothetical protein